MGYRLTTGVQFRTEARDFSLLYSVQAGCEVHPASYTIGTRVSFHWGEEVGA
jgi:hypothetical protein